MTTAPLSVLAVRPRIKSPPPLNITPTVLPISIPRAAEPSQRIISYPLPLTSSPPKVPQLPNSVQALNIAREGQLLPIVPLPYQEVSIPIISSGRVSRMPDIVIVTPSVSESLIPRVISQVFPRSPPGSPLRSIIEDSESITFSSPRTSSVPRIVSPLTSAVPRIASPRIYASGIVSPQTSAVPRIASPRIYASGIVSPLTSAVPKIASPQTSVTRVTSPRLTSNLILQHKIIPSPPMYTPEVTAIPRPENIQHVNMVPVPQPIVVRLEAGRDLPLITNMMINWFPYFQR